MTLMTAAALALAVAHYLLVTRHRGFFTGDGIFIASQLLGVLGTFALTSDTALERRYDLVIFVPFAVYCLASIVLHLVSPIAAQELKVTAGPLRMPEVLLAAFSALIVIVYFMAVGYNTFIVGVTGVFTGVQDLLARVQIHQAHPTHPYVGSPDPRGLSPAVAERVADCLPSFPASDA